MARRREENLGQFGEIQEATERILGPRQPRVGEQLRRVGRRIRRRYAELGLRDTRRGGQIRGAHVPLRGTVLDAGAGTGMFGSILRVLGYEDIVGIDISERMLEKAREKDAYRGLHRMVLGEPLSFDAASFSAAVCVGVFTTNHAPPEALDEVVRVVEPVGWVIFSVRDDVYRNEGFEEKQASLKKEGRWRRVAMSEAFHPYPAGNTSNMRRLFVYKIR